MSIQEILNNIQLEDRKYSFNVRKVPNNEHILVGLDSENCACIFVKSGDTGMVPSIKTSKLQIEFNKEYKLFPSKKEVLTGTFHSVRCLSNDPNDTRIFLTVMDSILTDPSISFDTHYLTSIFYSLVSLFKVGTSPNSAQERQGLWAELFFMKKFGGFKSWAKSWHSDPDKPFDFSQGDKRVEVKSTVRPERIHEFAHRQLFSLASEDISIVSVMLRDDDTGLSLRQLLNEASLSFKGTPYFIKLELASIRAGMANNDENGPCYNETEAETKTNWIKAEQVPKFESCEPEGVSGTRYRSDLTNAQKMSPEEIDEWKKSFEE
jgi:hypothetical protein